MHFQILSNFINKRVRKDDIFVPATILFLVRNGGRGTPQQISRLLYIFDFRHDLSYYDTIVEKFSCVMLKDYNIIEEHQNEYRLTTWPLSDDQIEIITKECMRVSNGFFSNIKYHEHIRKAS